MTPEVLQKDLCEEIRNLMEGVILEDENKKICQLNVYEQLTPLPKNESEPKPFPYCTVGLTENHVTGIGEPQKQDVILYFGICYWNEDRQWQHTMLTMLERIKKRFLTDPILGPFSCNPVMDSVLDDEDDTTYPHYFGGMKLTFDLPNYYREDDYC